MAWLENELPLWVKEALISETNAQILLKRYKSEKSSNTPLIALVIFGSLLIGLGVISIFAYNWQELGLHAKTFIAIAILVLAQGGAFWVKRHKSDSLGACEGISLFWFLAFGGSLAIIAQSYNPGGSLVNFLQVWALLSLPLMYLFNSRSVALLLFVMIMALVNIYGRSIFGISTYGENSEVLHWTLLLLWLPFYILHLKNNLLSASSVLLNFAFITGAFITFQFYIVGENINPSEWSLFCAFFWLLGVLLYDESEKFYRRVFEILSKIPIFIMLIVFCKYDDFWRDSHFYIFSTTWTYTLLVPFFALFIPFCMFRRDRFYELLIPLTPILFYMYINSLLLNIALVLGAVAMIAGGAKKASLALANQGLVLISFLIAIHFFDSDLGFLLKGVSFIFIGFGFLGLNLVMKRYIKDEK
ncbi:MAG: DUF2157 domain-containing protein [Campylobacteraceae bacterium]|nr:DUF2157 domain-containing protein [Campylobacteraceae bacterium]